MPTPIAARASGRALLLLALACLGVPPAHAAVSFREEVAPILVEKCLACHNAEHRKGSYRLDTFERLKQPGESGELPLQPGDPGNSPLYRLLVHPDAGERMPKKAAPLSGGELGAIRAWIEEGALFDGPSEEVPLAQYARLIYPDPPERYGTAVPVTALAFAASGKALYCGGEHELLVWDLAEGRITRRIPRLPRRLHLLLALPDGERLVAARAVSRADRGRCCCSGPGRPPPFTRCSAHRSRCLRLRSPGMGNGWLSERWTAWFDCTGWIPGRRSGRCPTMRIGSPRSTFPPTARSWFPPAGIAPSG